MKQNCDYKSTTTCYFYDKHQEYNNTSNTENEHKKEHNKSILSDNINKWNKVNISKLIDLPNESPCIDSISEIYSCIDITFQKIIKTPVLKDNSIKNWEGSLLTGKKLIIEGLLNQKITYVANIHKSPVYLYTISNPFSTYILVDSDILLNQNFIIETFVENTYAHILSNRNISINSTILIKASPLLLR